MSDSKPEQRALIKAPNRAVVSLRNDMAKRGLSLLKSNKEDEVKRWLESIGAEVKLDETGRVSDVTFWDNTAITDAGLVHLKGMTGMKDLHLSRTGITDAGLVHLEGLKNLRIIKP